MTTLMGVSLADRPVLMVGGGAVTARRLRRFVAEGALVKIVSPALHADAASVVQEHDLEYMRRTVRASDLDDVWFVHTATGDARVDDWVARLCEKRRVFCVNASDGSRGTALLAAEARAGGSMVGIVSDAGLRRRRQQTADGCVSLVGGGPGAPDLLTIRGRMLLAEADVVVTDRLAPIEVLNDLGPDVEVINVGKRPGAHPVPQESINALLVAHARAGRRVVRLKGGDPFLFGRGGEEMAACLAAGVAVEVVPGVSSALAVPQTAGIPVTHRGVAAAVHVVNGQGELTPATLAALADPATTTVILMGVAALPRIVETALTAGVAADLPVAIVENGHTSRQRTTRTTLASAASDAHRAAVSNPAVIVVGNVARPGLLRESSLATTATAC